MLFPYDIMMNYLMTLNHRDFWNNRTTWSTATLCWKASAKVITWQSHIAISKVCQNPGVSLYPSAVFLPPSCHEAIFLNTPAEEKHCFSLGDWGEPQRGKKKKKVRHLNSFFPNQLSVGLYYVCKAKSWSKKTTCCRVLDINTTLKYLDFVLYFRFLNK